MTREEPIHERKFVPVMLPWIVAAAAFLAYALTLNHWISLSSVEKVARMTGLAWQPELSGPLYWLVTYPVQLLPAAQVPLVLNLLSAVFAALALALLARSVALLPHDRTQDQRIREKSAFAVLTVRHAWLPPAVAVLVCGLQLTFWEHATTASASMFDLLIFAYVIRCLLEFRLDGRASWLFRASFTYAASMTSNWAMIGFFPVFLAALLWIKGLSFFNMRFLVGMFLWGLAGLCFYLLMPLVNLAGPYRDDIGFWQAVRFNLVSQKTALAVVLSRPMLLQAERPWWVLGLASLLPLLAMGIRWPSFSGDVSRLGKSISNSTFHLFHGGLLLYCLWITLDPPVSPRNFDVFGLSMLPLYYLGALAIGYFIGYFLLVFGVKASSRVRPIPDPQWLKLVKQASLIAVWALAVLVPALLVYRNLPQVAASNGRLVRDYADLLRRSLPQEGGLVLSDDANRMWLVQSDALRRGEEKKFVFLNTGGSPSALQYPQYHRYLKERHGARWPVSAPTNSEKFEPIQLMGMLYAASETNRLTYLHPSFGYYFEVFYPTARGMTYHLNRFPTNSLLPPAPGADDIRFNQEFWTGIRDAELTAVRRSLEPSRGKPRVIENLLTRLKVPRRPNQTGFILAQFYSRSLTYWGVELQRAGLLKEAESALNLSLDLNPANLIARMDLECNKHLQSGAKPVPPVAGAIQADLKAQPLDQLITVFGPLDDPWACFEQGKVFFNNGNRRQAARQFARAAELDPQNLVARLTLARLHVVGGSPDSSLEVLGKIRADSKQLGLGPTNELDLVSVEASAYLAKSDVASAVRAIDKSLQSYPEDQGIWAVASQVFTSFGYYSNSLEYVEKRLRQNPQNPVLLLDKGYVLLQLAMQQQEQSQTNLAEASLAQAILPLTRVIALEREKNTDVYQNALFNRAVAHHRGGRYAEARADLLELLKGNPDSAQLHYSLGELSERLNDKEAAVRHYQLYLQNAPTNAPDPFNVSERLKTLEGAQATKSPGKPG